MGLGQAVPLPSWQSRIRRVKRTPAVNERVVQVGSKLNWEVRETRNRMVMRELEVCYGSEAQIRMQDGVARESGEEENCGQRPLGILQFKSCHQQH